MGRLWSVRLQGVSGMYETLLTNTLCLVAGEAACRSQDHMIDN